MYPNLHPSDRQSQISASEAIKIIEKNKLEIKYFQFVLEEGEILYCPPFWFHEVKAIDQIVMSLNIWSRSVEFQAFNKTIAFALPMDENYSSSVMGVSLVSFFSKLISNITKNKTESKLFFKQIWKTRFENIFSCSKDNNFKKKFIKKNCNFEKDVVPKKVLEAEISHFLEHYDRIDKLTDPQSSQTIKKIQLAHYIEYAINWLVGTENVDHFFCFCLLSN
jgi:hypothetical protein